MNKKEKEQLKIILFELLGAIELSQDAGTEKIKSILVKIRELFK